MGAPKSHCTCLNIAFPKADEAERLSAYRPAESVTADAWVSNCEHETSILLCATGDPDALTSLPLTLALTFSLGPKDEHPVAATANMQILIICDISLLQRIRDHIY